MTVLGGRVADVGGSIAGCAAALALRRAGCEVLVYKRTRGMLRDRGAGIAIPIELWELVSVVLPDQGFRLPAGSVIEDLDDAELAALDALLGPAVEELLPLFLPRRAK